MARDAAEAGSSLKRRSPGVQARASEGNVVTTKETNVMSKNSTAAAQIVPFRFETREVRTLLIDDQPWFCAADVCAVLGYANSRKAVADSCREAGVTASDISSGGQKRRVTFISEGNLYRLIIKSRKDEAQRFESWVCDEVLPAIRKHGRYEDASGRMGTLVGDVIGSTGEIVLDRVIDQKGYRIDPALQRSFKHTMKSRLRTRFNVQKTSLIPADQLADACNFIAAYALEGEFLPKKEEPAKQLDIHFPVSRWLKDCPAFAKAQELQAPGKLLISPRMLYGMDFLSPTLRLLNDLARAGYNVEACKLEAMAARDLVQRLSSDLYEIQRLCGVSLQQGIRFQVAKDVAA